MAALLFGFVGICLVWTLAKNWARKYEMRQSGGVRAEADANTDADADNAAPRELDLAEHEAVYRRIFRLRLTGLGLCLVAIAILYLGWHGGLALLAALVSLALQIHAFRLRHAHLKKYRFVPGPHTHKGP